VRRYAELTPEAEADLAEAYDYYEGQISGLGRDFVATLEKQLERVVENPSQYQAIHRGVRRAVMRRFPYAVFYFGRERSHRRLGCRAPSPRSGALEGATVRPQSAEEVPGALYAAPEW